MLGSYATNKMRFFMGALFAILPSPRGRSKGGITILYRVRLNKFIAIG
jgi:hypothetical protein